MVGQKRGVKAKVRKAHKTNAGTLLRAARKKKGLVLREVAAATGLSFSAVAHLETGLEVPTIKTCWLLAKFYRISFSKLIKAVLKDEL